MARWLGIATGAFAALALSAALSVTSAETLLVSYAEGPTYPGGPAGVQYSFDQSSDPTPISYVTGEYTEVPIWNGTGIFAGADAVYWYSSVLDDGQYAFGPQGYTGPESAPVFAPGTLYEYVPSDGLTGALTLAVPEPSVWAMLLVGIGTVGAAMRQARRKATAEFATV